MLRTFSCQQRYWTRGHSCQVYSGQTAHSRARLLSTYNEIHARKILPPALNPRCLWRRGEKYIMEYSIRYPDPRDSHAEVFWRLQKLLRKTSSSASTVLVNAGRPRRVRTSQCICHNCSCGKTLYRTRFVATPSERPRTYLVTNCIHEHCSQSACLFPHDTVLRWL